MSIENAEEIGFMNAWDGKVKPADWKEWPVEVLEAWCRGVAKFHAWK